MNYLKTHCWLKNSLYFQLGYVQFDFLKVWATVAPDGQVWQNRFWHFLSILWLHIFHAVIKFRILLFEAFLTSKNPDSGISLYRLIPQGFLYEKPSFFNSSYSFYIFTVYSLVFDYFYFSRLYQLTSLILTHQLAYHFLTHNVLCGHA